MSRPVLEYAAPVWHHSLNKSQKNQIEAIQRGQYESYTVVHVTCLTLVVYILLASRTWINAGVYCRTSSSNEFCNRHPVCIIYFRHLAILNYFSRLRAPSKYPRITNRTKIYQSFICYALVHYQ